MFYLIFVHGDLIYLKISFYQGESSYISCINFIQNIINITRGGDILSYTFDISTLPWVG